MKKKLLSISENNAGILTLTDEGGQNEIYLPFKRPEEARHLLLAFYETLNSEGVKIKDAFWENRVNWFPAVVSFLYWYLFYPFVQYRDFIRQYPAYNYLIEFNKSGSGRRLADLLNLLHGSKRRILNWQARLIKSFINAYNHKIISCFPDKSMLFYEFRKDNFRASEILKVLDELKIPHLRGVAEKKLILRNFISTNPEPFYCTAFFPCSSLNYSFEAFQLPPGDIGEVFRAAVLHTNYLVSQFKQVRHFYEGQFRKTSFSKLLGLDDANYTYPIVCAARDCGIQTFGFQHGAYCHQHAAYMMEGFGVEDYCWYDNILVWGDFWKDLLAKASSYYPPGVLRVAANKHIYKPLDYSSIGANGSRKILVPYEFLANTEKIGCYIRALLMKGYEIYFKTRPDEPIDAQLDCYLLTGEERNQIVIVEEITDELMKKIDIVAGTSTTLIYDLLPYRKQTWVFDTDFCLLDQLVIRGVSKLIHLETLEEDIRRPLPEISIDFVNYVFRQIQLPEALREVLIS